MKLWFAAGQLVNCRVWVDYFMNVQKGDAQEQARNKKLENMQEEEVREKNVKNKSRGYGEWRNMEN